MNNRKTNDEIESYKFDDALERACEFCCSKKYKFGTEIN